MRFSAMTIGFLLAASMLSAQQQPQLLEIRVEADAVDDQLPPGFTVFLVNKSDHDVHVPTPAVGCASPFSGNLGMASHFTPKRPIKPGNGFGCSSDTFFWPPILERIKEWKILGPGESLEVRDDPEQMHCTCKAPGKYEFWADYNPPDLTAEDKAKLDDAGIDYPRGPLESAHVVYIKTE